MSRGDARPLVVIGCRETAQRAHDVFTIDLGRRVIAFSAEPEFLDTHELCGLPVVPFDKLPERFPPSKFDVFVAVGSGGMNAGRKRLCEACRDMGYALASCVSPRACVGHHVALGDNAFIMDGAVIGDGSSLGDGVTVWNGAQVSHLAKVGDYAWIAPAASFGGEVSVGDRAFIGVNATVLPGVHVGRMALVGAGCVLTHDAAVGGVYAGVPGRLIRRQEFEEAEHLG